MLQRAASNAYSWWWASHIRTKQSKWLEHNLQDMEEKVQFVLKLINEDGDSFAKRAEMYYRKRPEILDFIEEAYRAYRALAERYDHISGELQNANHTIATVFPEQVQFAIDEEEDQISPKESPHCVEPSKVPKQLPEVPKVELPKLLKIPSKTIEGSPRRPPKKMLSKKISKITVVNSQMTKEEALAEIDRLQKRILTLQTEKEFIKSSYENRIAKYQEIETEIAEMQDKVSSLQDEFSVGMVIEDHDARILMASTALRSCEETLAQLQATQGRSIEEARVEHQRIKGGHEKLESLKDELLHNKKNDNIDDKHATNAAASALKVLKEEVGFLQKDRTESELLREKIREHFKVNSDSTFSVTELAEKIDELVTKVITLETAVSSQTALIQRLRSQTNELLKHLHGLEADKAIVLKDSSKLSKRLRELEEELQEVQELNRNVEKQNDNLETHFTEAHCNLDHLSDKLKNANDVNEESEVTGSELQEEASLVHPEPHDEYEESQKADVTKRGGRSEGEDKDEEVSSSSKDEDDLFDLHPTGSDNLIDLVPKEALEVVMQQEDQVEVEEDNSSLEKAGKPQEQENSYEEDTPNWKELFLKGLDDREKILLQEYTSTLRKYKEAKKKLSDTENKNRDSLIETMVQLRELKSSNAVKDEEIRSLRKNLTFLQATYAESFHRPNSEGSQLGRLGDKTDQSCSSPTGDRADESRTDKVANIPLKENKQEEVRELIVTEARTISPIEEKFRRDIDDLLEENLEFWLRFSTAFHQIQNFQTAVHDLQTEYSKLKDKKKQEGSATSTNVSQKSDARPIYKHLREIQTELTVWSEQNLLLKDELKHRLSSLNNIQEEISRVLKSESGTDDEAEFTSYQAAKFQGEILNMKQENNKVATELQSGLDHVNGLHLEIEKTLAKIDEDFKLSGSKTNSNNMMNSLSRTRIPLRSFLFGVKAKKTKPSLFSCMSPALQKQYSDLHGGNLPLQR